MKLYLSITQPDAPWSWWSKAVHDVHHTMARDGGHDWAHLARVYVNARQIWEDECRALPRVEAEHSWCVVAAAALFHDVINLPKDSPERALASTRSGEFARDWLVAHAHMDREMADAVHEAIRAHSYSAGFPATTREARILSDADRLDALGAVGIARTFAVGGQLSRPLFHAADPLARHREPDDALYTVDHFFCKLLKLKDIFFTLKGRQMADERDAFMRQFLDVLEREALLEPPGVRGVSHGEDDTPTTELERS